MLDVKYVTFSGTGSWTFVTGFRLRLYKSNRNQLSGLPSLPLLYKHWPLFKQILGEHIY